ncbi:CG4218 [Drosophila busckii]|uniref:CG4218 n=2 Tax=Drosophila busckii TaxID=30019 RepID=A0A0M4E602_DROBS|nr:CG4218 [Drosophila busckii]
MASKQPTTQQLAYLDELKQRLKELRMRQETFMEQTAEMLRDISTASPLAVGPTVVVVAAPPAAQVQVPTVVVDTGERVGSIKQLIQRFEDLRQSSKQFSDLQMPEELVGVDVRKLLKDYERLILEGNVLQKSWSMLKKTTESCARQSNQKTPEISKRKPQKNFFFFFFTESIPEKRCGRSKIKSKQSVKSIHEQDYDTDIEDYYFLKKRSTAQVTGHRNRNRFGAMFHFAIRFNPLKKCMRNNQKAA